jgi:hypothetical protein
VTGFIHDHAIKAGAVTLRNIFLWRRVNPVLSAMKRPPTLTILMWFCAIYAIGAVFGIAAVIFDLGRYLGGYSFKRKRSEIFTVIFYGLEVFDCKTAQLSETLRESLCLGLALKNRLRNIAKICAKTR